ncbi:MAG TPA: MFS transporter [Anaerolineae bacterium]|nr:MFS transporter [Anaerolineae bacterium]
MRTRFLRLGRDNILILLSMLFWGSGEGLWFYVQPLYVKSLGANSMEIGLVLSVAPVLMVLGFIPGGVLADRYGRRRMILVGSCAGTVSALLLALAGDWRQSIVGFVLYYASACGLPAIHAYIAHSTEEKDLNRVFSLVYAAFSVGLTIFPTVGGWIADLTGFAPVLVMAAAFYALSTLAVFFVEEQPVERRLPGSGLGDVLSNRRLLVFASVGIFVFLALQLGQPFAPNYLQEVVGVEIFWIGFLGSAHALGAMVLGVWLGRLSEGVAGFVVGQGLVLASLLILVNFQAIPVLLVSFFLRGAFNACKALALAQAGKTIGETNSGLAYGVLNTALNLSWVLAPYTAAWLYTARPDLPFLSSAAMIAVMMVVSWALLQERTG